MNMFEGYTCKTDWAELGINTISLNMHEICMYEPDIIFFY